MPLSGVRQVFIKCWSSVRQLLLLACFSVSATVFGGLAQKNGVAPLKKAPFLAVRAARRGGGGVGTF